MFGVAKLIRAPLFFLAVRSQANVGGAASAPVVASAFHPALAPVGELLSVKRYALGTSCACLTELLFMALAGRVRHHAPSLASLQPLRPPSALLASLPPLLPPHGPLPRPPPH